MMEMDRNLLYYDSKDSNRYTDHITEDSVYEKDIMFCIGEHVEDMEKQLHYSSDAIGSTSIYHHLRYDSNFVL